MHTNRHTRKVSWIVVMFSMVLLVLAACVAPAAPAAEEAAETEVPVEEAAETEVPVEEGVMRFEASVEIARPLEEVWEFASDPANAPRWIEGIEVMELTSEGPLREGAQGVQVRQLLGLQWEIPFEITEFESGSRVAWKVTEGMLAGYGAEENFAPTDIGTQFTYTGEGRLPELIQEFGPEMASRLQQQLEADLQNLKNVLEAEAGVMRFEASVEIARPLEEVWEFASDPANAPRWIEGIEVMELTSEGPLREGAQGVQVRQLLGLQWEIPFEITEFESGSRVAWKVTEGMLAGYGAEENFAPTDIGTQFTYTGEGRLPELIQEFGPEMASRLQQQLEADLQNLKNVLEAQ